MDPASFDEVRRRAREIWSRGDDRPTSYQAQYKEKNKDYDPLLFNPTTEERRNRPHPSLIFMSCQLKSLPGYFDPDSVWRRDVYQVDGMVSPTAREAPRGRYTNRPSSPALRQYHGNERYQNLTDSERHAAVAWDNINPDNVNPQKRFSDSNFYGAFEDWKGGDQVNAGSGKDEIMSLQGYMKMAADDRLQLSSRNSRGSPKPVTLGQRKAQDILSMSRALTPPVVSHKGDYTIHSGWPPRLKNHRLNGLTSPWPV